MSFNIIKETEKALLYETSRKDGLFDYLIYSKEKGDYVRLVTGRPAKSHYKQVALKMLEEYENNKIDFKAPGFVTYQFYFVETLKSNTDPKVMSRIFNIIQDRDIEWTFNSSSLQEVFGEQSKRTLEIKQWLFNGKYEYNDLRFIAIIGNLYTTRSINLSYTLSLYIEKYEGEELDKKIDELVHIYALNNPLKHNDEKIIKEWFLLYKFYYDYYLELNGENTIYDKKNNKLLPVNYNYEDPNFDKIKLACIDTKYDEDFDYNLVDRSELDNHPFLKKISDLFFYIRTGRHFRDDDDDEK